MTAPLSGAQNFPEQVTGIFGAPRGRIRPRGSYSVAGVGDPTMGHSGYGAYWTLYPYIISGESGYGALSTATGSPIGTPDPGTDGKVGGGALDAQVPDYGGTAGSYGQNSAG